MVICYGVVMAKSAEAPEVIQVDLAWARSEAQRQKGDELRMRAATGQTACFFFDPLKVVNHQWVMGYQWYYGDN